MSKDDSGELADMLKRLREMQQNGLEVDPPTVQTPILAALTLQMAQINILELMSVDGPESDAAKAFEHVQKAIDLLHLEWAGEH